LIVGAKLSPKVMEMLDQELAAPTNAAAWHDLYLKHINKHPIYLKQINGLMELATYAKDRLPRLYALVVNPPEELFARFSTGDVPAREAIVSLLQFGSQHNPHIVQRMVAALTRGPGLERLAHKLWRKPDVGLESLQAIREIAPELYAAVLSEFEKVRIRRFLGTPLTPRRATFLAALGPWASRRILGRSVRPDELGGDRLPR
jgi:hypothetical protein